MWQAGAVVADRLAAVAAAASPSRGVAPEAEPRAAASGQAIVSQLEALAATPPRDLSHAHRQHGEQQVNETQELAV
eukprot:COSAG05_NODE_5221_length_1232_cov_1.563989_1_plen_76_part_00